MAGYDLCTTCGAMVGDMPKHHEWHGRIDDIEAAAAEANDTADRAANVLYQNDIGV